MSATGKTVKPTKTWKKTKVQGLYVHNASGKYYSRTFLHGKENWTVLEATTQSVAEVKHATLRAQIRKQRKTADETLSGDITFAVAVAKFMELPPRRKKQRKESAIHYRAQVLKSLLRDWPELEQMPVKKVSVDDCVAWSARHASRTSSTRYNAAVGLLRGAFDYALERGVIFENPMRKVGRAEVESKRPSLPSRQEFTAMVEEMKKAGGRFSKATADFVSGLAFTGLRLNEAARLKWQDIHFDRGVLEVHLTKNDKPRNVPLIPAARSLFERMKSEYPDTKPGDLVFRVREAQKSLDRAAERVGAKRITHHGLRHLFATACIENGVDIPTVSRWLGHQDGGALALKVYGHLRDDHSKAAAAKVTF